MRTATQGPQGGANQTGCQGISDQCLDGRRRRQGDDGLHENGDADLPELSNMLDRRGC
jgi:hypothetical protein